MQFFKSKPSLPNNEKSRLEYHLQQIAEAMGRDRLTRPVLSAAAILPAADQTASRTTKQIMNLVGDHLGHDTSGISLQMFPMQPVKSGGGG